MNKNEGRLIVMSNEQTLFSTESHEDIVQSRGLYKTAELTSLSISIAKDVIKEVVNDKIYREEIIASQKSNDAMDALIKKLTDFDGHPEYDMLLEGVDGEELEKMLKSQQSKRSRLKSKLMTIENYQNMMAAGVAEILLRRAGNMPKGNVGVSRHVGVGYSEEELIALAEDQEALGRAIRNVQSKKCIMKGKAGFDVQSEEYVNLLKVEETLVSMRTSKPAAGKLFKKAEKVDAIKELLGGDIENLNGRDSKELLKRITEALATE